MLVNGVCVFCGAQATTLRTTCTTSATETSRPKTALSNTDRTNGPSWVSSPILEPTDESVRRERFGLSAYGRFQVDLMRAEPGGYVCGVVRNPSPEEVGRCSAERRPGQGSDEVYLDR
jgi:hypothetical protein